MKRLKTEMYLKITPPPKKKRRESWLNSGKRERKKDKSTSEMKIKLQAVQRKILIWGIEERAKQPRKWKWHKEKGNKGQWKSDLKGRQRLKIPEKRE